MKRKSEFPAYPSDARPSSPEARQHERRGLLRQTVVALAVAGVALVALSSFVASVATLGWVSAFISLAIYGAVGAIIASRILAFHPHGAFGWPNVVTLARTVLAAMVAGYTAEISLWSVYPSDHLAWTFAIVASVAVALDGLDGWLARRIGPRSDFGARFDMESDALLLLILSVLAFVLDKAGAWVLLIGGLRYAFVAAACCWAWMDRPLEPSLRRKAVCAIQGITLCMLAMPVVSGSVASGAAALALALIIWSFAIDIVWLWRRRATAMPLDGDPA
jgi:phosphatidylglycerophosphate synthase